jgi:hypothetical protein
VFGAGEPVVGPRSILPLRSRKCQAAAYLGCSFWTARDYILQGLIPIVYREERHLFVSADPVLVGLNTLQYHPIQQSRSDLQRD